MGKSHPNLVWANLHEADQPGKRNPGSSKQDPHDLELLDAYSQAVVGVVETISPAVLRIVSRGSGSGSGFLISPEGLALTNSHVLDPSTKPFAETEDGDRFDILILGNDPATDLALVQLSGKDLPHCQLGDSDHVRPGQLVIALGSPLGLQSTVSTGVVSATGRSMRGRDGRLIENVLQHAAPINPGSSGGPLVDSRRQVVGINTAIVAQAQGLGFAIPVNTSRWVVSEFLQHGRVRRRRLGVIVRTQKIPRELIRRWDLLSETAVRIVDWLPESMALNQGLQVDDLLISINDRIVTDVDDVHRLLTTLPADSPIRFELIRKGQRMEIEFPVPLV